MTTPAAAITIDEALVRLAQGRLVGVPTETEWGLAADARHPLAIERLFQWKGRRARQPVSVLVTGPAHAARLGVELGEEAQRLMEAFWPGPLTLVVPGARGFAPGVVSETGGLGLRCSVHPVARSLAAAAESHALGPVTATSLNRSGSPGSSSRNAAQRAIEAGNHDAPALLEGECWSGRPSSVVDCTGTRTRLLREGELSLATLSAVTRLPIANANESDADVSASATPHC